MSQTREPAPSTNSLGIIAAIVIGVAAGIALLVAAMASRPSGSSYEDMSPIVVIGGMTVAGAVLLVGAVMWIVYVSTFPARVARVRPVPRRGWLAAWSALGQGSGWVPWLRWVVLLLMAFAVVLMCTDTPLLIFFVMTMGELPLFPPIFGTDGWPGLWVLGGCLALAAVLALVVAIQTEKKLQAAWAGATPPAPPGGPHPRAVPQSPLDPNT